MNSPLSGGAGGGDVASSRASAFRRSRSEPETRREAFEKLFGRRGLEEKKDVDRESLTPSDDHAPAKAAATSPDLSTPRARQQLRFSPAVEWSEGGAASAIEHESYQSLSEVLGRPVFLSPHGGGESPHHRLEDLPIPARPLHDQHEESQETSGFRYYRVVYRGVTAVLSRPEVGAPRSGSYLAYGEVFRSRYETISHDACARRLYDDTDPRQEDDECGGNGNDHQGRLPFVRVDCVLTGGYAMDSGLGRSSPPSDDDETPRRSNMLALNTMEVGADENLSNDENPASSCEQPVGYLLRHQNNVNILEELQSVPISETGRFIYQVTSSVPLPILTGPSMDAPKTKAMLLPGTILEISLRICLSPASDDISYLRLSHRRGWIPDRRFTRTIGKLGTQSVPIVKELHPEAHMNGDDSVASHSVGSSIAISSVSATTLSSTVAKTRHRPPRRRRDIGKDSKDKGLPRNIVGGMGNLTSVTTPVKANRPDESPGVSPSSNVSIMSDDASTDQSSNVRQGTQARLNPALVSLNKPSAATQTPGPTRKYFLFRVTAPCGLKILDAPQTQVNNLIHRRHTEIQPSLHSGNAIERHKSHNAQLPGYKGSMVSTNPAIFDSNSRIRILPHGVLFEASSRMESSAAFNQGAGLIKLSDNSGWAIIPRYDEQEAQFRLIPGTETPTNIGEALKSVEEIGNAVIEERDSSSMNQEAQTEPEESIWLRVCARQGVQVACHPPVPPLMADDNEIAAHSSPSSLSNHEANNNSPPSSKDSDVASSVGSNFLDAMFRTPKKSHRATAAHGHSSTQQRQKQNQLQSDLCTWTDTIPCGMIVEVEPGLGSSSEESQSSYMRLRGDQGWVPLSLSGKMVSIRVTRPESRMGSFWFRVKSVGGIKVRLGPSKKAPAIKSADDIPFRFECGEFLRASEVMTVFNDVGDPIECFAKLYRNRHVRFQGTDEKFRSFPCLTLQAEWVNVYDDKELFLEECGLEPRIERHKQGWRYTVLPAGGVVVRRGPAFAAAATGKTLHGGETVCVTERVRPAGEKITWLRMKDGNGWIHDKSDQGEELLAAHTLRPRVEIPGGAPVKPKRSDHRQDIAYSTIIARLFHNDGPDEVNRERKEFNGLR